MGGWELWSLGQAYLDASKEVVRPLREAWAPPAVLPETGIDLLLLKAYKTAVDLQLHQRRLAALQAQGRARDAAPARPPLRPPRFHSDHAGGRAEGRPGEAQGAARP
jgi:hypothetical protein